MKIVYILIAIIIGAGVWMAISGTDNTAPANTNVTSEENAADETSTPTDEEASAPDTEAETPDESEQDMPGGTDVGMEFPNPDNEEPVTEMEVSEEKVFEISGSNYAFDVEEIRVAEGDTVTIHFTSADGFHDWVVDEFDAATERVSPGDDTTSVTFVADAAGTYEYYCSVGNHREQGMVGTLIVE